MVAIQIAILLAVFFGLVYMRASILIWTLLTGAVLIGMTVIGTVCHVFLGIAWLVFLAIVAFAYLTHFRQKFFTEPLIHNLQKRMPPISQSEREAIEAGNVWWEKDLFCGRPRWKKLLAYPHPTLSQEEQDFLDNEVNALCEMIDDWEVTNDLKDLSPEVWDFLKKERFLGMVIPKEYGGRGFSALGHSTIVVQIATRCVSAAVNTMVPNSLGPAELILHYGTTQQKDYYLPKLAKGEEIPCFALTGPEAGSDAGSITDTGVVCLGQHEGKEVLGFRLTWDKRYITLAPVATVLGIAFQLYDPNHLLGDKENIGITLALIPTSHPGVEMGDRHIPLSLAFMNGPTRGRDVFVPMEWIIGGGEMVGQGWRMIMESLAIGRSISLPALSTACGKLSYRMTGAYARLRRQFNVPIAQFEGVEEALGYIAGYAYTLEATRIMTAGAVDLNIRPSIASAIAKYHMTEMARKVIEHAMDVHAGHGIQMGPRNFLAAKHFAIPVSITVEGANILTRNLIIFGQGAIRCHPYIQKEVDLLSSPESPERLKKLDRILLSHIGYTISNFVRTLWSGLTGAIFIFSPVNGVPARYYRQLTRMSSALALLSDMSMLILGGALKRKERISGRLGDILSQLYLASAVLKYYKDNKKPKTDIDYVSWSVETCLYNIQIAINDLLNNFPIKWLGAILKSIIFPWGDAYKKPDDQLTHRIVATMLEPSEFRDRLTRFCYISPENNDPMRRIENALLKVKAIDPIWKKFQVGLRNGTVSPIGNWQERMQSARLANVLTEDEMSLLSEYEALYQEVIHVNEFSFDLKSVVS